MTPDDFMRAAIAKTREGITAGQTPFGAVVVRDDAIVASAHNTVWRDRDPTAHGEVNAIRAASKALRTIDLSGCTMFSTCEPCPMCLSAIHWAKIDAVIYGALIADAQSADFCELAVDAKQLAELGGSRLRVERGPLRAECAALFAEWRAAGLSRAY